MRCDGEVAHPTSASRFGMKTAVTYGDRVTRSVHGEGETVPITGPTDERGGDRRVYSPVAISKSRNSPPVSDPRLVLGRAT